MFDHRIKDDLIELMHEWDRAEGLIKEVELIRNEVVFASILELRYAGRKLIDALHLICENNNNTEDGKLLEIIKHHIFEATQNCVRARNDAVDACISYIHNYFIFIEDQFGGGAVVSYFPEYTDIKLKKTDVEKMISISRDERDKRQALYDDISDNYIPRIADIYKKMGASTDLMIKDQKSARMKMYIDRAVGWGFGIIGIILAVVFYLY